MFDLAGMLGVDFYAAKKIIDIVATAGTVASVIGIIAAVAGTGGIGVGILAAAKALARKYGTKAAATW